MARVYRTNVLALPRETCDPDHPPPLLRQEEEEEEKDDHENGERRQVGR
jgi:hypothetical protein